MASSEALTEYERRRLDNIRRNDEMMSSLLLHNKAADLAASAKRLHLKRPHAHSPPSKKPKPSSSPIVFRRSLRTRGIPPGSAPDASPPPPLPPSPPPASKRDLIGIGEASLGSPSADRELLDTLLDMADRAPLAARRKLDVSSGGEWQPRDSLVLKPESVKRLLPSRILSVVFFPFKERSLIAAGDKSGHVGFWDVDRHEDGAYLYAPHSDPVSSIVIQPFDATKVFSSSYDGFIRQMDVENETFNVVYKCEDAIYSASHHPEGAHSLFFGEGNGWLKMLDEREAMKHAKSWVLHDKRINTIDFNSRNNNLMATSSSDGTVCLWDLRRIRSGKPNQLKIIQHNKSVHSAFFSPSGGALATTSLDNRVRILSGDEFDDLLTITHFNQTGRWISTFRAIWGWDESHLFIGNMKRAVDVISRSNKAISSLVSEYMTAIPSRFAAHPYRRGSLACTTAGGQIYLWTS